jgi:hypothetical protein
MNKSDYSKNKRCKDCNKKITNPSIRCKSCAHKGNLHPLWKKERPICIDCKKEISRPSKNRITKRCRKCYKKWVRLNSLSGELHPNFINGKTHNNKCIDCGKKICYYAKRCMRCANLGIRNPMSGRIGDLNPNWNEGLSKLPYAFEFTEQLKESIRQRDNNQCQLCKRKQYSDLRELKRKLAIHHINYDKQNCSENNLITLCHRCNTKTNFNRDYWFVYFTYIMENK